MMHGVVYQYLYRGLELEERATITDVVVCV